VDKAYTYDYLIVGSQFVENKETRGYNKHYGKKVINPIISPIDAFWMSREIAKKEKQVILFFQEDGYFQEKIDFL